MQIGELSKQAGISIDTVRYYEQRGLIPAAQRSLSGYRQYSDHDSTRLKFIVQAKELGFTLDEVAQLLALRTDGRACVEVRAVAEAKADEIDQRIQKLTRMRQVLLSLAAQCEQTSDADPCPILKSLEDLS
ncbi:MAG: MerR family DNA-binding protein [Mariprofundus sp.]|nr:MerR family DNA-binding protein [Mariprofundus sp.]